ncbi:MULTISPECIES: hypothetical protein [unclassified Pseudomonas]|uniref:hypothetical protein n=1 Tax=unclassified Pseudomonas TaxID=196821 RepID=UPI0023616448|nr:MULTISPECIES: hypothetical protein [unclassified Pseudomonas]
MADVELRLQADLTDAQRNIAGFRKEYGALVREVEKPLRQVNAFRDLETALEETQRGAKASAQSALRQGDFKTATEQAEQARQMLLDMQQAGQSTYGLEGFAKQLQAIELAANDLEKTDADKKLDAISTKLADLKSKASELENLQVTPTLRKLLTTAPAADQLIVRDRRTGDDVVTSTLPGEDVAQLLISCLAGAAVAAPGNASQLIAEFGLDLCLDTGTDRGMPQSRETLRRTRAALLTVA